MNKHKIKTPTFQAKINGKPIRITLEGWEADEFIVCLNGRPTGGTLHRQDSITVARWLSTAINEIIQQG